MAPRNGMADFEIFERTPRKGNGNGNGNGVTVTKQVDVIGLLVRILVP